MVCFGYKKKGFTAAIEPIELTKAGSFKMNKVVFFDFVAPLSDLLLIAVKVLMNRIYCNLGVEVRDVSSTFSS